MRYKAARLALGQISESFAIPIENLVTPDFVRRIAWTPPEPIEVESISEALAALGARDWQIELTAQQITAAFVEANQNIAVTVEVDS
ncbi:hypothetical protein RGU41_05655 [Cryobacterium sp. 10C3]|nr:hypothetical protein [Cryobacterium sp. 10C3]MDY7556286.1 hypothetical protein [Cryobacterium sp. 10C3]